MSDMSMYIPGNSFFHKCDAKVKMLLLVIVSIMAFLFHSPYLSGFLLIVGAVFNYISIGNRMFKHMLTRMIIIMMFFLIILHGFVNPRGETPASFFGQEISLPFFGAYTYEGFYLGLVFWLRLSSIIMMAELFISTTSPSDLIHGLHKLGVPYNFCFMVSMSLQLIPISVREAQIINSAQRARGLPEKSIVDRFKGLLPMFVPLVVSSLERMERTSMALECRGFGNTNNPTSMSDIVIRKSDIALMVITLLLLVACVIIRIRFGSFDMTDHLTSWADCFRLVAR
ncbi:MAG: energy-coupling factor transporter transmembrane protein EcfT [Erysipelotrichaceae bacterium]|nr:energy-coupling factor transporter transmembrane protein EcfT [Erysipelotrichaceae bacterium]